MKTYEVIFKENETEGVYAISLVDSPAMESAFIALSEQKEIQLKAIDVEKRILLGAVLIPNKPIYRKQEGQEFNITFPEKTIQLTMENFFKKGYQNNSTLEHNEELKLSDVTFVESWIKESEIDKSVHYGFNEPNGTWFASMKVNNNDVWENFVKTGKVSGFSIDGFFDLKEINLKSNNSDLDFRNKMVAHHEMAIDMVNEYEGLLKDKTLLKIASDIIETQTVEINTMQKLNLKSELNMSEIKNESLVDTFKTVLADFFRGKKVELGSIATKDGSLSIEFEGDTISVGTEMFVTNEQGEKLPLPDGEYILEDGMTAVISAGKVSELKPMAAAEAPVAMDETQTSTPAVSSAGVKSEKFTQEVFYQLAQVMNEQLEKFKTEFKAELKEASLIEKPEPMQLTKRVGEQRSNEPQTAFQKFREFNKKFN